MDMVDSGILSDSLVFQGEKENPFLAPRGVWMSEGKLIVSDTGQNRVFIWNQLPDSDYAACDRVLGQNASSETKRNSGADVNSNSLLYPSGVWADENKLIVADAWNHRILIWYGWPKNSGQAADVVIGQPDMQSNQPNVVGIGNNPSSRSLNWPYGIYSDGQALWIADTGNRRVLYYEQIPQRNYQEADGVIGKSSFEERDYDHVDAVWPYSVKVSPLGELAIADTQYYRVLIWKNWKNALESPADLIIGQADFEQNGQNQFQLHPSAHSLNWCYDAFFSHEGLWVTDTGNSRILRFDKIPTQSNRAADDIIGHGDFHTGSESAETKLGTENKLYWPFSICIENDVMAIADTGNHRIILKKIYL